MEYYCYVIYSKQIDSYYIGYTSSLEERLHSHNLNHKGFTGRANDWKYVYYECFGSKSDAYARERRLKSWKSRKRLEQLIQGSEHPDV